jgi:hypothetical protein
MIQKLIEDLVENPTEETKQNYLSHIQETEYSLLEDAEKFPFKSWEHFNQRREAFSYRSQCAKLLLIKWVGKYGNTKDCPVSYADTLNVPFQQIKSK